MVIVSASVNLPLNHKVQKFSSGAGSPMWSRKKGRKTVVVWWWFGVVTIYFGSNFDNYYKTKQASPHAIN